MLELSSKAAIFYWVDLEGSSLKCSSYYINTFKKRCPLMGPYIIKFWTTPQTIPFWGNGEVLIVTKMFYAKSFIYSCIYDTSAYSYIIPAQLSAV